MKRNTSQSLRWRRNSPCALTSFNNCPMSRPAGSQTVPKRASAIPVMDHSYPYRSRSSFFFSIKISDRPCPTVPNPIRAIFCFMGYSLYKKAPALPGGRKKGWAGKFPAHPGHAFRRLPDFEVKTFGEKDITAIAGVVTLVQSLGDVIAGFPDPECSAHVYALDIGHSHECNFVSQVLVA